MTLIETDETEHSERGPSTAHRWRACPGSVERSRGIPNVAGIDAAHGTVFHEYAAMCIEFEADPQAFVGEKMLVKPHGWITFDQAMANHMLNGLDIIWALMNEPGAKWIVEKRVSLENWIGPKEFGTTDFMIWNTTAWKIVIWDWKYGAGVPVNPEQNDQAILYFLGAWDQFAKQEFFDQHWANMESVIHDGSDDIYSIPDVPVQVMIEQPRAKGGGGTWNTTVSELLRIGEQIKRDARETYKPGAAIRPGEKQCRFCPAARVNACEDRARFMVEALGADFDDLDDEDAPFELPKALSPEARTKLLLAKPMIDAFMQQLHGEAYSDLQARRPAPGLKLVEGRHPARKWRDPDKAEILLKARFGEDAFKKTLLSPSATNDKIGDADYDRSFRAMVDYGEPKPEMVPESDKREALPDLGADFDDDDVIMV